MKDKLSDELLIEEFLEALRDRATKDQQSIHHAFVAWYVEAEFGGAVDWKFTDDAGDAGIDAIVRLPGERPPVVVIQSKFSERVGKGLLFESAYEEFDQVIEAFHTRGDTFDEFLQSAREDLRVTYRKAFKALEEIGNWNSERKAFRLITTLRRRPRKSNKRLPKAGYHYADDILALYRQYRKGHTPQARDLVLQMDEFLPYKDPARKVTSYLFNARVEDFRGYCETSDVGRLVARNIRYNLAGPVGKRIRDTYENQAHDFWYLHNGITVICDGMVRKGSSARLVNPSVVNGAQTLYAIAGSSKKSSPALVATRVVVRAGRPKVSIEDDEWVQRVIRGVNTQNRVKAQDFRSNDPAQLELQRLFRDHKVFYERKRGEWKEVRNEPRYRGFARASLKDVGMALVATSEADGAGVVLVKRGAERIFGDDKMYHQLFPSRGLVARRFEQIYFNYRLAEFVRAYAYKDSAQFRKQKHSLWTVIWLAHEAMAGRDRFFSSASTRSIRNAFDAFDETGVTGRQARAAIKKVREVVWASFRKSRRIDFDKWTPNNFFKSQWGHDRVRRMCLANARRLLQGAEQSCRS